MKVFADFHHAGLYASLHYLFEDRLGYELYRPIGMDWFTHGYWKIAEPYNNAIDTVKQYLEINNTPQDGSSPLNNILHVPQKGVHYIWDFNNEYYQKAITLDKFMEMDFDFIIASIPAHIDAFKQLIFDTGSKAKLIYQIGNIGWHSHIPWKEVDNVMASVNSFPFPSGKNVVFYRQEFKTTYFDHTDSNVNSQITSFVNCLPKPDYFLQLEQIMPEVKFKSFGISCRDGIKQSVREIANEMKSSMWGYHLKPGGDGFGHVIHNWFAANKPILVGCDDYKDKLAGQLLEDKVTCIDISKRSPIEVAKILRGIGNDQYKKMVENVADRFNNVVNFDEDEKKIGRFLNVCL